MAQSSSAARGSPQDPRERRVVDLLLGGVLERRAQRVVGRGPGGDADVLLRVGVAGDAQEQGGAHPAIPRGADVVEGVERVLGVRPAAR